MLMSGDDRADHDRYIERHLETGRHRIIGIGREVQARRKDGTLFTMELAINAFNVGEQKMFVGSARDITERKLAQQQIIAYARNRWKRSRSNWRRPKSRPNRPTS